MMGPDIEGMISGVQAIKKGAIEGINAIAAVCGYKIKSQEQHAGLGTGVCFPLEVPQFPVDAKPALAAAVGAISSNRGKLNAVRDAMYTPANTFNNSIGSPWAEVDDLIDAANEALAFGGDMGLISSKAAMFALLNVVVSCAADAKAALTAYHEYTQKGYDNVHNANERSVQHTSEVGGTKTIGQVRQDFSENANVIQPPARGSDPYGTP